MKDKTKREGEKIQTETFYRIKRVGTFEYACEAVEVPVTIPKSEPVKRNLKGIVAARMLELMEK